MKTKKLNEKTIFSNSLLISGTTKIGKTKLLLSALEYNIKMNKKIIVINQKKDFLNQIEEEFNIQELAKKYNREKDIIIYNKNNFNLSENKIFIIEYDNLKNDFDFLNNIVSLYSDLKEHELFLFIDEINELINNHLFNEIISYSTNKGLKVFISKNSFDFNECLINNIKNKAYFKFNDNKSRTYLSEKFNLSNTFFLDLNKGDFIFQENETVCFIENSK